MAENTTRTQFNHPHHCPHPTFGRDTRENQHLKTSIANPHNRHTKPHNDY